MLPPAFLVDLQRSQDHFPGRALRQQSLGRPPGKRVTQPGAAGGVRPGAAICGAPDGDDFCWFPIGNQWNYPLANQHNYEKSQNLKGETWLNQLSMGQFQ